MNNIAYKIKVMQAFADGGPIEWRNPNWSAKWICCPRPKWDWIACEYRVAEKPSCNTGEQQRRERIVEAFKGGAKVEARNLNGSGNWGLCGSPVWSWSLFDYRIVPQATACAFILENDVVGWVVEGSDKYNKMMHDLTCVRAERLDFMFDGEE